MRSIKYFTKRGLALLLVLVMCMGMLQITAFAEEPEGTQEPVAVETAAASEEPSDETPAEPSDETPEEPSDETPEEPSDETPEEPSDETPEEPSDEISKVPEEIVKDTNNGAVESIVNEAQNVLPVPAEVQAFLDAVAAIPADINPDNAEEVGAYVYGEVADAYEALLGTEYADRADVREAAAVYAAAIDAVDAAAGMESESYLDEISGHTPADRFYYDGAEVAQLYLGIHPKNIKESWINPSESLTVLVGDKGSTQRLYTHSNSCRNGHIVYEETPEWITVEPNSSTNFTNSDPTIVKDITWGLEGYVEEDYTDAGYGGYPALTIGFTGNRPGTTNLTFYTWQEYYYYINNYNGLYCGDCSAYLGRTVSFSGWVQDKEQLNITVNARYQLNYNLNGGAGTIAPTIQDVADTTAALTVTSTNPTRNNYTFKEWNTEADGTGTTYQPGDTVTLDWSDGYGSTDNPVSMTLYAIWEEDGTTPPPSEEKTYTVFYVDGVNREAFPDQGYEDLKEGEKTPEFKNDLDSWTVGDPTRDGYTFEGWKLTSVTPNKDGVQSTVAAEDADENGEIIYTATWEELGGGGGGGNPTNDEYKVTYEWTGLPEGANVTPPAEKSYKADTTVTVDTSYTETTEITVGEGEEAKTYVFSGWSTDDVNVEDGTFTMPKQDVTIRGEWTEKTAEEVKYTVKYTWTGLPEDAGVTPPADKSYEVDAAVTVDTEFTSSSTLTVNGKTYLFSGWDKTDFTMPAENVTIHGSWTEKPSGGGGGGGGSSTPKTYTVHYTWTGLPEDANVIPPADTSHSKGASVTVDTTFPEGAEATAGGRTYVFSGWDRTGKFTMPAKDVTISGSWTERSEDIDRPDLEPSEETPNEPPEVDVPDRPPVVDISDEEPPLVDIPEEEPPLVDIPDEEPPLVDIPDEDVPLSDVPKTGDSSQIWGISAVLSGAGLVWLTLEEKKRKTAE